MKLYHDNNKKDSNVERFYFYSKGKDFINVVNLMNYIAFPATIEEDCSEHAVNESLHALM
jgi:hypothetical protein